MKKLIILMLAVVLGLSIMSCGGKTPSASDSPTNESPTSENPPTASPEPENTPDSTPTGDLDDLSYILDKGTLIIGITPYAPMNYEDETGKLVGFDTEFAEALCANLGIKPEFKWIDWNTKEIELKAGNIDVIWNGLTVTEERRENMAFTNSYLRNEQVVVVRTSDIEQYTDLASLAGARLVAEDESAGATAIESDLPEANYTAVINQATALLEVKSSTADAAVIDYTMARAMTGEGTDYSDLTIVDSIKMQPEEYAIGLRVDSTAVGVFNELIFELNSDGTLTSLAAKYDVIDLLIK